MSQMIRSKLSGVRSKHSMVATGTGISQAIVVFIAWIAGMMILDWLCNMHLVIRILFFLGGLALTGWIFFRNAILPVVKGPDVEELALKVEHEETAFKTRLIAAIQFSSLSALPAGASPSLVQMTLHEAESMSAPLDFNKVIKTNQFLKTLGVALLILVLGILIVAFGGDRMQNLLQRAFLSPADLLTRTRVIDLTDVTQIAQGDSVTIRARADGYRPYNGIANIRQAGKPDVPYPMTADKDDPSIFTVVIPSVQESFKYKITLYDGTMPSFKEINVKMRPAVISATYTIASPAYTGTPPETKNGSSGLQMLAGSRVKVDLQATKKLAATGCVVQRYSGETKTQEIPLTANNEFATGVVDIPAGTTSLTINLLDAEGIASVEAAVCGIEVVPDDPPGARLIRPERDKIFATKTANLEVQFYAEDDWRLGSVVLKYQVDKEGPEVTIPLPENIQLGKFASGVIPWDLAKVKIPVDAQGSPIKPALEGSKIEYWIEAKDTNTAAPNGPGVGRSERHMVTIVSEEEFKAAMMAQVGESFTQIEDTKNRQVNISGQLGNALSGEDNPPATQPNNK